MARGALLPTLADATRPMWRFSAAEQCSTGLRTWGCPETRGERRSGVH